MAAERGLGVSRPVATGVVKPRRFAIATRRATRWRRWRGWRRRSLVCGRRRWCLNTFAGALGGLDEYSTFLTAGQLTDIYSQIDGNFVGLGVELKAHNNALLIMNVIPGSPAERAGIKRGDRLTGVAGRTTHDLTTDQAAELLQGEDGTTVEVVAVTGDERRERKLTIRREHVDVPSIENAQLDRPEAGDRVFEADMFSEDDDRGSGYGAVEAVSRGDEELDDGPARQSRRAVDFERGGGRQVFGAGEHRLDPRPQPERGFQLFGAPSRARGECRWWC